MTKWHLPKWNGEAREKTIKSGECVRLQHRRGQGQWFDVSCWTDNGECRWLVECKGYEVALKEYNRWD